MLPCEFCDGMVPMRKLLAHQVSVCSINSEFLGGSRMLTFGTNGTFKSLFGTSENVLSF